MLTAESIRNVRFEKTAVFGYKAEDVDRFLDQIEISFKEFEAKLADADEKLIVLADALEEYRDQEESLKTTLIAAQKLADNLVKEAKTKSEEFEAECRLRAETELEEALTRAESISQKTEKDRKIAEGELAMERERAMKSIRADFEKENRAFQKMQKEIASFKANLLDIYKNHIALITSLPDVEEESEKEAKKAESNNNGETLSESLQSEAVLEERKSDDNVDELQNFNNNQKANDENVTTNA